MNRGKLISIEGTDCSGKETQSKLLIDKMPNTVRLSFPMYDSPTGKIVGGCYLGKEYIGEPYFAEGADKVDYQVACCYFAADRKYNSHIIEEYLNNGINIILDRYVESNMAHQGGKILDTKRRFEAFQFIHDLEYNLLKLRRPDKTYFLYMPYEYSVELRKNREEKPDQHEKCIEHLKNAEKAYLELCKLYGFETINCVKDGNIRTPGDINEELYEKVNKLIRK